MNLRFPEFFGATILLATVASIALPRPVSGRVENTLQFLFAPIASPLQRMLGDAETAKAEARVDPPILPATPDAGEIGRLRAERREWERYATTLREQLETLRARQREFEQVSERLRDLVHPVNVVGVDASGRDVIRLAATSTVVEPDAAVAFEGGLVGRVQDVGAAGQASVRLITDRGFKLVGRFLRARADADGTVAIDPLPLDPTLVEGMGNGEMRIDSLKTAAVAAAGLRVGDALVLSADPTGAWRIELHGQRIGRVTSVGESATSQGIAEVRVRPEVDLMRLRSVWLILPPQRMPARD